MGGIFAPYVAPLAKDVDVSGLTAIVTGATSGIGLALCIQLLERNIGTLILAVRNTSKGEDLKSQLLSSVESATNSSSKAKPPRIEVFRLEGEDYESINAFADEFISKFERLDILFANAGIGSIKKEVVAKTGHEKNMQVNYYANFLLILRLFPLLEATSTKTGNPSRVTITGSRMHRVSTVRKTAPPAGVSLLQHFNDLEAGPSARYGNSKMAVLLFVKEMGERLDSKKVILNEFCPGSVKTGMVNVLPAPVLFLYKNLYYNYITKSPEEGAWIAMRAGVVFGEESHGKLIVDDVIEDYK